MRRFVTLAGLAVFVVAVAGLFAGSAAAAGNKKLVEGTVYDTTCATACTPECPPPPHCGPITQEQTTKVVCAQRAARLIVCPLAVSHGSGPDFCIQGEPCGVDYPVYSGKGATVNVRKRGSATVLAALPVVEGHFEVRLGPGEYVLHPRLPEEPCLVGIPETVEITARTQGPLPVSLNVGNTCVAHPDAAK
jgi:hypothetical protein